MDILRFDSLDCAYTCCGLCYYGNVLRLPRSLQLPGRYLPSIRELCTSSAIVLPQYTWRNLLVTDAMFTKMTFAGAASFLGGVGVVLTIVPWVLVFYGPMIRARSRFASVSSLGMMLNLVMVY